MSEGNTFIAEPNLELLPLPSLVSFCKSFFRKNNVLSDDKK